MAKVWAKLLRPLDEHPIGAIVEYEKADFDRLEASGAIKRAPAPANKAEQAPQNKARPAPRNKDIQR